MGSIRQAEIARQMKFLYALLAFVPIAVIAELAHLPPLVIFATSALAILPLSGLLGHATEELAGHAGPTIGGLLNATLGNLAELIIAILALRAGLVELVKASITGPFSETFFSFWERRSLPAGSSTRRSASTSTSQA